MVRLVRFNTGSSLGVSDAAAMGFVNTQFAAGAAMAGWAVTSYWRTRQVGLLDISRAPSPAWSR